MSLTEKQKRAVAERDNGRSQIRHYSEEKGWHTGGYCEDGGVGCTNIHIHHIEPRRVHGRQDSTRDEVNRPENLITTYSCEHVGVCPDRKINGTREKYVRGTHFVIHPDTEFATRNYDGTPRSFRDMNEIREELLHDGQEYWDSSHDTEMAQTAEERTRLAESEGWHFPGVRGVKKETRRWKKAYWEG